MNNTRVRLNCTGSIIIAGLVIMSLSFGGCKNSNMISCKEEILQTDREFSDYSVEHGMKKAFLEYADHGVVLLQQDRYPIIGKTRLDSLFRTFSDTSFTLSWEPLDALVSESCDLGYTYGIYKTTLNGSSQTTSGKYVSIWKKQDSGSWKYVLDAGNPGLGE